MGVCRMEKGTENNPETVDKGEVGGDIISDKH